MREIKKLFLFGLLLMLCLSTSRVVNASDVRTFAEAYTDIVYNYEIDFAERDIYPSGLSYDLIFFDEDDIPELVVSQDGYWVSMYSYQNGLVVSLMEEWPYGAGGNAGYYYISWSNLMINYNSDMAGGIGYTTFFTREGDTLKDVGYIKYADMDYDGNIYPNTRYYKYNNNKEVEISQKEYNTLDIGRDSEYICGKYDLLEIVELIESF